MAIDYSWYYSIRKRRVRERIDLHSKKLREFILKKRMEKKRRKRRVSKIFKKQYHRYGEEVDGCKYETLLWIREEKVEDVLHDSNKAFRYEVTIHFRYRLRNGLYIEERQLSSLKPIVLTGIRFPRNCDYNNIPVGLATIVLGLGIPDTYGEAMFKDISRFAHKMINSRNDHNKTFTLGVQLHIVILQLEGEGVLYTKFRCEAEGWYRGCDVNNAVKNGKGCQPLHIQKYCASEDVEGEGVCCSICLGELRGYNSYILPCSHVYHYHCIFKWMLHSNICPFCRHPYCQIFAPHQIYPLPKASLY